MDVPEEKLDLNYEKLKAEAEAYYATLSEVECPYFNDTVLFNVKGLKHIKFKKDGVARSRADQYMRLKQIKYAQRILEKSKTLQEFKQIKAFEELKASGKKENVLQDVKYYGFVSIIKDEFGMKRLKIIVKQVGGGKPFFWSIIPYWKNNKEIRMYSGDLEND